MDCIPARPCSAAHGKRAPSQPPQGAAAGSGRCPPAAAAAAGALKSGSAAAHSALAACWGAAAARGVEAGASARPHRHSLGLLRHTTDLGTEAINLIMCIESRQEAQRGTEQLCQWSAHELAMADGQCRNWPLACWLKACWDICPTMLAAMAWAADRSWCLSRLCSCAWAPGCPCWAAAMRRCCNAVRLKGGAPLPWLPCACCSMAAAAAACTPGRAV